VPAEKAVYDDLLRRARLFVCPVRIGQPPTGIILEAQMMCTPVILPDVSDARELVTHGYNGIITDSLRPASFACHIAQLLSNDVMWSKLARNAHESIKGRTWDNKASEFLDAVSSAARRTLERTVPAPAALFNLLAGLFPLGEVLSCL
jgi:glycosyltransferase involved in cell wall biosynthesis